VTDDLVARIRAALDAEERALYDYEAHRADGVHLNYAGQDPEAYDAYDSCYRCIETARAARYRDVEAGRRMVAAHRKMLEWVEENPADEWPIALVLAEAYGGER
jgi:ABC-type nitrate/sulfonate/bicarbonate transport system substrate-binding protein